MINPKYHIFIILNVLISRYPKGSKRKPHKTNIKRSEAAKYTLRAHRNLNQKLFQLGFKDLEGNIYPHKLKRFFTADEAGGKVPEGPAKVLALDQPARRQQANCT